MFCKVDWNIEMKTISEANTFEHWTKVYQRKKKQKLAVKYKYMQEKPSFTLPCKIILTRISPRTLDFDNLTCSLKSVRDAVCDLVNPGLSPGRSDSDSRISIEYLQDKSKNKMQSVRIQIFCEI